MEGSRHFPLAGAGAARAAIELTENLTAAPKLATQTDIIGSNQSFNLTPPKGLKDRELLAKINSNFTLSGSFGTNNDGWTYLHLRENFPSIGNTTPDFLTIITENRNILKVFGKGLDKLNAPKVLFTHKDKIDPVDLVRGRQSRTKNLDNGGMTLLLTKLPYQYSPPVDTSDAIDSLPPGAQ